MATLQVRNAPDKVNLGLIDKHFFVNVILKTFVALHGHPKLLNYSSLSKFVLFDYFHLLGFY